MIRVLVAEDEPRAIQFIQKALKQSGMAVEAYSELDEVQVALNQKSYDVLILDRLLKSEDSLSWVPQIRKSQPQMKILVLTALSDVHERVKGLDLGADDYLGKPFHVAELVSRIRSLTRRDSREAPRQTYEYQYQDLELNVLQRRAFRNSQALDLTDKEFRLLSVLMRDPKKVFTRTELLDQVWDINFDPESNVVDKTIGRLRKKINEGSEVALIQAIRGVGYCLDGGERE